MPVHLGAHTAQTERFKELEASLLIVICIRIIKYLLSYLPLDYDNKQQQITQQREQITQMQYVHIQHILHVCCNFPIYCMYVVYWLYCMLVCCILVMYCSFPGKKWTKAEYCGILVRIMVSCLGVYDSSLGIMEGHG